MILLYIVLATLAGGAHEILQRRLRLHETLAQLAWLATGLLAVVLIGTATHH